jgi:hypothetical protein
MNVPLTRRPVTPAPGLSPGDPPRAGSRARKPPFKIVLWLKQAWAKLRKGKTYVPPNAVTYEMAAQQFLANISGVCMRTFPAWQRAIDGALADQLSVASGAVDTAALYPLDDLYFTGLAAYEASRLPALYGPAEADTVIVAVADQLDRAVHRTDRVMSDMFFEILARLNLMNVVEEKRPYDKIIKVILRRLDFDKTEAGRVLLADKGFRHGLAEPFALHAPQWWEKFKAKFVLHDPAPPRDETADQDYIADLIAKTEAARQNPKAVNPYGRQWRKKATSLFATPT